MFSAARTISVSRPPLDPDRVDVARGAMDVFDFVDAFAGFAPHLRAQRVQRGAPIVVGGWAMDRERGTTPTAVVVIVDGVQRYDADIGFSRRDVVVREGRGTPEFTGFRRVFPTHELEPAVHRVAAYALIDGVWCGAGAVTFVVYESMRPELGTLDRGARVHVDAVDELTSLGAQAGADGPIAEDHVALVRGWAKDSGAPAAPAGICARAPGGLAWCTPCDIVRPDVAAAFGLAAGVPLGFEIAIPVRPLGRGRHTIELVAFDATGRPFARPESVTIDIAAPVRPFPAYASEGGEPPRCAVLARIPGRGARVLDEHASVTVPRGTILTVEGWATRGEVAAIDLFIEVQPAGELIPPHRHFPLAGFRRDEAPREFPPPPAPDAWFWYLLGTANLGRGDYRLSLVALGEGRRTFARRDLGTLTVTRKRFSAR